MTDEVPPYVRFLATALESALDDLAKQELIEIEDDKRTPLVSELIAKAAQAETPKRMLKAVVRALVDSEHVEEVYATDDELREILKRYLETE